MLMTLLAFVVALGLLIAVHEWGHYRMAVARGVKVLRFSVGFGKTILRFKPRKQRPGQDTEFVIGAIPFGGYVKMLDEREGNVAEEDRHLAFNTQPLSTRALIVAAGPVANLVLAVLLYAVVNWVGVAEPRALLSPPVAGSLAQAAGLLGGELERAVALLTACCDAVIVVGRDTASVRTIADWPRGGMGPLGGISAALRFAEDEGFAEVLTIGVDCPDLPENLPALLSPANWPSCIAWCCV